MNNWNGIVSLLFASIELLLIINIFIFTEKNKINYLAIGVILLLTGYQFMEWIMCGLGIDTPFVAFLAFTDISFLPPLGLYFVLSFYGYKSKYFKLFFLPAIAFLVYYATIINHFNVNTCTVFYAVYKYPQGDLYGFFYYVPILITMIFLARGIKKSPDKKIIHLSKVLLTAYILISLPVIAAFILVLTGNFGLIQAIVSVMCKFAIILAVALTYFTLINKKTNE